MTPRHRKGQERRQNSIRQNGRARRRKAASYQKLRSRVKFPETLPKWWPK